MYLLHNGFTRNINNLLNPKFHELNNYCYEQYLKYDNIYKNNYSEATYLTHEKISGCFKTLHNKAFI